VFAMLAIALRAIAMLAIALRAALGVTFRRTHASWLSGCTRFTHEPDHTWQATADPRAADEVTRQGDNSCRSLSPARM